MRKKDEGGYEAKRKRQQREGYFSLNGVMAPPSLKKRMIVEGFLAEEAKDNPYAVMGATERWIERQLCKTATPPLPVQAQKTPGPKVKRQRHPQQGPCRQLSQAERAAAAAKLSAASERRKLDEEWRREFDEKTREMWREIEREDLATLKKRQDFDIAEKERRELAWRKMIESAPKQAPKQRSWQSYGESGVSKRGGKPLALGLPTPACGQNQHKKVKPIKQLTTKQQDERIKKKFGPLTEPDSSPHFVPMDPKEAAYKLDRFEAEDEGFGRGGKSRVRNFQGDDGFTKPGAKLFDGDN